MEKGLGFLLAKLGLYIVVVICSATSNTHSQLSISWIHHFVNVFDFKVIQQKPLRVKAIHGKFSHKLKSILEVPE